MNDDELMDCLWQSYREITPQVTAVHALLAERGENIVNDHVALRTFGLPPIDRLAMAKPFLERGFQPRDVYHFSEKHLHAQYYEKPGQPKVFISELELDQLPVAAQQLVANLVAQLPDGFVVDSGWVASGRVFRLTSAEYEALAQVSEYAAWVAAHGFRANHFTVSVGELKSVAGIEGLVALLQQAGFALNDNGGVIKGGAEVYLAQVSTLADEVEVRFTDRTLRIPSCYVEFAQRFELPLGGRYEGFVPASADRIFESTDRR